MKAKYLPVCLGILALLVAIATYASHAQAAAISEGSPRPLAAPRGQSAPDAPPSMTISDGSVNEIDASGATAVFTVTLSNAYTNTVTVQYTTADGTAFAGSDYTAASGTLTFPASATVRTIPVAISGDLLDEPDETFALNLSSPANATISDGQATGTIRDNDPTPSLSINSATSVTEGTGSPVSAVFTVTLSAPSGQTVTVNYATADGMAVSPGDFTAIPATPLTFNPGQTSHTLNVSVQGDGLDEDSEAFTVNLSSPSNATIASGTATGTILDNDPQPSLSVSNVSVNEGDAGTTSAQFTVSLSAPSGKTVTVNYATANGTAADPADFTAIPATPLTFNPGQTSRSFNVTVQGDLLDEADETFTVQLSGPSNATIAGGTATGTILDNDPEPGLSIAGGAVLEGNSGSTSIPFTATLSAASSKTITANYATSNGTATAPGDYIAIPLTPLTFTSGQTSRFFSVTVNGDSLDEANETFSVALSGPANATLAGEGMATGTINDDDPLPSLSISSSAIVTETSPGPVSAVFTVTLSAPSGQTVRVDYTTANGSASSPGDYTPTSGTLMFNAGVTSRTIAVNVLNDALDEANETFTVNLSSPFNATIANAQGTGTIRDNDPTPSLSINSATSVTEGTGSPVPAVFTVTLSAPSGQLVTVNYATADGTAVSPGDFTAIPATPLTFNPGQTSHTLNVSVQGDALDEDSEAFTVNLSSPSNATIASGTATGTILDNDPQPSLSVSNASVVEGDTGTRTMVFTVTLLTASGRVVTVDYSTMDGTAAAPGDYTAIPTTPITFTPGLSTTLPISVTVIGETVDEENEVFYVDLFNQRNATISDGRGLGTILNDDTAGVVVQPDTPLLTTESGGSESFTVTLSSQPVAQVVLALTSLDPSEGSVAPGSLTFTPANWSTPQTATVTGVDDSQADGNIAYAIQIAVSSADPNYNSLAVPPVQAINADNDTAGITANPLDGLVTSEDGGTDTFVMKLNTQPIANVTIPLSSSNPAEGILSSSSLTFTPENWDIRQTVTITGTNDNLDDGDIAYTILTGPAVSNDPNYNGMNAPDVSVTNLDNDAPAIEWVQPVPSNTRWKLAPNQNEVTLEVRAVAGGAAQADIGQVRFYRWDYENKRHVSIGTVEGTGESLFRFQFVLDATTLLDNDNQVFAVAYDRLGHPSVEQPYIFIFRTPTPPVYELFLPSAPRQ